MNTTFRKYPLFAKPRAIAVWLLLFMTIGLSAQNSSRIRIDSLRADSFLQRANKLNRVGFNQEALVNSREAQKIFLGLYGPNHKQSARAQMFVARSLKNLGKDDEALELFQQSLQYFERVQDTMQMAFAHYHLSLNLRDYRRLAESRSHITAAIQLIKQDSASHAYWLAMFNVGLASLYNLEKNYKEAIPILDDCKAYYTAQKDTFTLGLINYHYGGAWYGMQDYERAKEYYLATWDCLKDQLKSDHSYFTDLLVKLGFCYLKTGDPETGRQYLLESRKYFGQLDHRESSYMENLEDLGTFYAEEGQYTEAIELMEACLVAKSDKYGKNSIRLLRHLPILGETYWKAGKYSQAESCFRKALEIVKDTLGDQFKDKHRFFEQLAEISYAQGKYAEALSRCDSAFLFADFDQDHPEKMHPRNFYRELCQLYGKASFQQFLQSSDKKFLLQADHFFEIGAAILEKEIQEIRVNSSREVFYDQDHQVLEQWLDTQMRLYVETGEIRYAQKAFQISGQQKSFLLYEAMRQSGALHYAGVPDSILQKEFDLRERIQESEAILERSPEANQPPDGVRMQMSTELTDRRKEYETFLGSIEQKYPEYFRLRISPSHISINALQHHWLAPSKAILMYSLTETSVYLFVVNCDTFCVKVLPLAPGLLSDVEMYRKAITSFFESDHPSDALYEESVRQYTALAQSLYEQLVSPVAGLLSERVVIIPEGKLYQLPFETLLSDAPKMTGNFQTYPFWAKEKSISYCFSTDLLAEMYKPALKKAPNEWLGIAPFAIASDDLKPNKRNGSEDTFYPLPFSGKEVNSIAAMVNGQTWLREAASPGRFQKEAQLYRILHLATHSRADDRQGNYSYLATAATGQPLFAKDLYQLSLPAEMVVLSACEAGEGKLNRGEGIIGLVRAFAFAGARSVVASMWLADDQSTAGLMQDFYGHLLKGEPKDVALKNARINFIKQMPNQAHPFYWAGFRLYGQPKALWK